MQEWYSFQDFARMARVSKPAITKAARAKLKPAVRGKRIDVRHPAAVEYLTLHGGSVPDPLRPGSARSPKNTAKQAEQPDRAPTSPAEIRVESPSAPTSKASKEPIRIVSREVTDISAIADMTIRQVVAQFGTVPTFKDWLDAGRKYEDLRERNLRNAETEGKLISVKLVQTHVMGAIDSSNRRLLTDSPKTLARRLYAAARSDVPIEQAEQMVREIISSQLKPMKEAAARMLRNPDDAAA